MTCSYNIGYDELDDNRIRTDFFIEAGFFQVCPAARRNRRNRSNDELRRGALSLMFRAP